MYFTAVVLRDVELALLPKRMITDRDDVHQALKKGDRVSVFARTLDKLWSFVIPRVGHAGWMASNALKRDPILIPDISHHNFDGKTPPFGTMVNAPGYAGVILKATEGTKYPYVKWFLDNWRRAHDCVADPRNLGITWFVGAYHFLIFNQDGADQADYHLDTIERAGGLAATDMMPIVDVEEGSQTGYDREEVETCVTAFAKRIKQRTKRGTTLYTASLAKSLGITSHMGCKALWTKRYKKNLPPDTYQGIGWLLNDIGLWQVYDGTTNYAKLPFHPDLLEIDHSVSVVETLPELRALIC